MQPRVSLPNNLPSAPAERKARGRKILLKAANDNTPPLSYRLKKILFWTGPIIGITGLALLLAFA
ncbi:MAG: hypothetical protein JJ879_05625 [Sneathiella sp.]|nr:hypothetical protein [Sneathiella sp.]